MPSLCFPPLLAYEIGPSPDAFQIIPEIDTAAFSRSSPFPFLMSPFPLSALPQVIHD